MSVGTVRSRSAKLADVLTCKAAAELEIQTYPATFRRVSLSLLPFRMNAMWCQRSRPCATQTLETFENRGGRGKRKTEDRKRDREGERRRGNEKKRLNGKRETERQRREKGGNNVRKR